MDKDFSFTADDTQSCMDKLVSNVNPENEDDQSVDYADFKAGFCNQYKLDDNTDIEALFNMTSENDRKSIICGKMAQTIYDSILQDKDE